MKCRCRCSGVINLMQIPVCVLLQILSMIEEAAGTRMYESKKQQALRTMEKKEMKLSEINAVSILTVSQNFSVLDIIVLL